MAPSARPRLVPELAVRDLAASLRFWTELAGFGISYERPAEGFAFLERDGAAVMLEQPDLAWRTWPVGELQPPFGRGINFEISVDDVDAILRRFEQAGTRLFMAPETKWYRRGSEELGVRQFLVQDPDGYLLRFSQAVGVRPAPAALHDPSRAT